MCFHLWLPRNASDVSELEGVIKSQVVENTLVRRSHILEDCIRGTQKRLFAPEKSLVVSFLFEGKHYHRAL